MARTNTVMFSFLLQWLYLPHHNLFILIGEAYVHGIMDGEFFQSDPATEEFSII